MKAIILAGGAGRRFRIARHLLPKSLVPLQGKPLIAHVIEDYAKHPDVDEVIVLCGKNKQVRNLVLRTKFSKPVTVHTEDKGVVGDILDVKEKIGNAPFLVGAADNLVKAQFPSASEFSERRDQCIAAVTPTQTSTTWVETIKGQVTNIYKNPRKSSKALGLQVKIMFAPETLQLIQGLPKRYAIGEILIELQRANVLIKTVTVPPQLTVHITQFSDWWRQRKKGDLISAMKVAAKTRIPTKR